MIHIKGKNWVERVVSFLKMSPLNSYKIYQNLQPPRFRSPPKRPTENPAARGVATFGSKKKESTI